MTADAPLRGLWCATLTPVHPTGAIADSLLVPHIARMLASGCDGVVLFGTTGEGPSFSVAERSAGLETVLSAGIPPERIVSAVGCAALSDTVALVRHALASGCPRCLVLPPFFWRALSNEAVYRYYAAVIDAVGDPSLRLYLYHFPDMSGVGIEPEVVARLASDYPGIVAGVKDSSGDFARTQAFIDCAPDLSILVGHEPHIPQLMTAGGAGTICGAANLYPDLVGALLRFGVTQDDERRLQTALHCLAAYPFVPAYKAVLAALSNQPAWANVRPPLLPLPAQAAEALMRSLVSNSGGK